MWREVWVSHLGAETLCAVIEDDRLVELHTTHPPERSLVNNIYKGKVKYILNGVDAAFIDIGEEQDGFLYVSDLQPAIFQWLYPSANGCPTLVASRPRRIRECLREGEEILVQIKRDPIYHKAPRVSTKITLPGTYLVYTPTTPHVGVSSRITDPARRQYLKTMGLTWVNGRGGLIFRTASTQASDDVLFREWQQLYAQWLAIIQQARSTRAPRLIHRDIAPLLRLIRDLLNPCLRRIAVDHPGLYRQIRTHLQQQAPEWLPHLKLLPESLSLFHRYSIHQEIRRIFQPRVWLKSGAYLIINQTEALVTIDVNTGRNPGVDHFQDSVFRVNMEALEEIVRQIRLRNLSGLILIDFIDMDTPERWQRLREALEQELKRDRLRTHILPHPTQSVVLLTRQRTQPPLVYVLSQRCPTCHGQGLIYHPRVIAWEILSKLTHICRKSAERIVVRAHPEVIRSLQTSYRETLREISRRSRIYVELQAIPHLPIKAYSFTSP